MGKRTTFVNITPLPPSVTREVAVSMLQNHDEMIELNPLVIEHHPIKTPRDAPADEFLDCAWQELTDKVHYLPGGIAKGKVTYRACFHDLPNGLQTHIYAPLGLDIREKWTVCGTLPGEPEEPRELGLDTPRQGLYLKEEGDMRCNVLMTGFVRKNLDNSHKVLVERILGKASRVQTYINQNPSVSTPVQQAAQQDIPFSPSQSSFQAGSHMSKSSFAKLSANPSVSHSQSSSQAQLPYSPYSPYGPYGQQQVDPPRQTTTESSGPKQFAAEMEGSTGHYISGPSSAASSARAPLGQQNRTYLSELEGSDSYNMNSASSATSHTGSRSFVSELPSGNEEAPYRHPLPSQNMQQSSRRSFEQGDDGAVPDDYVAPLRTRPANLQPSDRFSVISGVSDMQTPRLNQDGFEDNRFSVVSAMTPRPQQTTFN